MVITGLIQKFGEYDIILYMKFDLMLNKQMENGRLGQSYMVTGDGFDGVRDFMANKFLCSSESLIVLDRESVGIEDIRIFKKDISSRTFGGKMRIAMIKNADNMTAEAQNAFLKILEEPESGIIFFLFARDDDKVLDTVKSRCQKLTISREFDKKADVIPKDLLGGRMSYLDRFNLASKLAEDSAVDVLMDQWQVELNELARNDRKNRRYIKLLKSLKEAMDLYTSTNANKKLIFENLLLDF